MGFKIKCTVVNTVLRVWFGSIGMHSWVKVWIRVNDPSAGSPTETLLRLLLPLNDKV